MVSPVRFALFLGLTSLVACGDLRDGEEGTSASVPFEGGTTTDSGTGADGGGANGNGDAAADADPSDSGDASSGPNAIYRASTTETIGRFDRPLQTARSCTVVPPVGEYLSVVIGTGHGGPIEGTYVACSNEDSTFSSRRCVEAGRVVGGTDVTITKTGDSLSVVKTGSRYVGTLTTAGAGVWTFDAEACP
jgi:hypothetical protein